MKQEWQSISAFWSDWEKRPVDPLFRLLLSSDGTTVRSVKSLFLRLPVLEVVRQEEVVMDAATALQLEAPEGEKAVERAVWLNIEKAGGAREKLLYAVSTLPVSRLEPALYQALQLGRQPLGQLIDEQSLPTFRDRLEVAHLPFVNVAKALALKEDTLFWARRYRLSISGQASAIICEIFSPRLSSLLF
ncbi:MAG: chorismate--pyruvate lyase family protein [Nitrospiria bacterium]